MVTSPNDEYGETSNGQTDRPASPITSVLFVCGMNCIRSPIAEALVRDIFPGKIFCDSAGANAGEPDGFAASVMAERGVSLDGHIPKTMEELEDAYFDLIVTLSPEAHHKVMDFASASFTEVEYWPTLDPSTIAGSRERILDGYRQVRDTLEKKIRQRFS